MSTIRPSPPFLVFPLLKSRSGLRTVESGMHYHMSTPDIITRTHTHTHTHTRIAFLVLSSSSFFTSFSFSQFTRLHYIVKTSCLQPNFPFL